jgi:hypothetical protein
MKWMVEFRCKSCHALYSPPNIVNVLELWSYKWGQEWILKGLHRKTVQNLDGETNNNIKINLRETSCSNSNWFSIGSGMIIENRLNSWISKTLHRTCSTRVNISIKIWQKWWIFKAKRKALQTAGYCELLPWFLACGIRFLSEGFHGHVSNV